MMNWEKRKEEIQKDKLLNSYFIAKYEKAIDNLIEQEKEMIRDIFIYLLKNLNLKIFTWIILKEEINKLLKELDIKEI